MSTFGKNTRYFSGQGVVLAGLRDVNGRPKGLIPLGNVSALKVGLGTTVIEHKESQTGQRAVDKRLTTETKSSIQITMEDFSPDNLAMVLLGGVTDKIAASVTDETSALYHGKVMPLKHLGVSAVTVTYGSTALTAYTNDTTPFDYYLNADSGSFKINDGSVQPTDKLTTASSITAPSDITEGNPTKLGWSAAVPDEVIDAGVGAYLTVSGVTGTGNGVIEKVPVKIVAIDTTAKTVDLLVDTTALTLTLTSAKVSVDGEALTVDYSFITQQQVDAMIAGNPERYLRFEGLNTAEDNSPCVVEVFRFMTDPLKELALISDDFGQFVLDGNVLADAKQTEGSQFFKVTTKPQS